MRLLQNVGIYPSYAKRLSGLSSGAHTFTDFINTFRQDRFEATHLLEPVLSAEPSAFLAIGNYGRAQQAWALEHGLKRHTAPAEILLAQLEAHRAEVFYNLDPARFDDSITTRLPGCVKQTVAWSAAPTPHQNFRKYGLVVSNFPGILQRYAEQGCKTSAFAPSFDPDMAEYASVTERPIDILFVGGYSRHHIRRAGVLEAVAALKGAVNVRFHLDLGRLNRWAELPLPWPRGLARHRRPAAIKAVSSPGIFGRDLYAAISRSKIVLNAAVDMAGAERGNIRCFEAMGCGALLLSDAGHYPAGMVPGDNLVTYRDAADAVKVACDLLHAEPERARIAQRGNRMISSRYSKAQQWANFVSLCA